jgi:hypothetical protein
MQSLLARSFGCGLDAASATLRVTHLRPLQGGPRTNDDREAFEHKVDSHRLTSHLASLLSIDACAVACIY